MNIRERSFEGLKVGDSLYDHFTKDEINNLEQRKGKDSIQFTINDEKKIYPNYYEIYVSCKTSDKKLSIFFMEGVMLAPKANLAIEGALKLWAQIENRYPHSYMGCSEISKSSKIDKNYTGRIYEGSLATGRIFCVADLIIHANLIFWKNNERGQIYLNIRRDDINLKNLKLKKKYPSPIRRTRMHEIVLKRYLKNYKENNSIQ